MHLIYTIYETDALRNEMHFYCNIINTINIPFSLYVVQFLIIELGKIMIASSEI